MMLATGGILILLLYLILMALGIGMFIFLIVLGMKAMRALDIYIRKNQ